MIYSARFFSANKPVGYCSASRYGFFAYSVHYILDPYKKGVMSIPRLLSIRPIKHVLYVTQMLRRMPCLLQRQVNIYENVDKKTFAKRQIAVSPLMTS